MATNADDPALQSDQAAEHPDSLEPVEAMGFGTPPDDLADEILQLHAYWHSRCKGEAIPDRSDLDPLVEIPRLLSNVWLLDVEDSPRRYRYRLLGSSLHKGGPRTKRGKLIQEGQDDNDMRRVFDALARCCAERRPFWRRGMPLMTHDHLVSHVHTIALPLTVNESEAVRMLMNMSIYRWRS